MGILNLCQNGARVAPTQLWSVTVIIIIIIIIKITINNIFIIIITTIVVSFIIIIWVARVLWTDCFAQFDFTFFLLAILWWSLVLWLAFWSVWFSLVLFGCHSLVWFCSVWLAWLAEVYDWVTLSDLWSLTHHHSPNFWSDDIESGFILFNLVWWSDDQRIIPAPSGSCSSCTVCPPPLARTKAAENISVIITILFVWLSQMYLYHYYDCISISQLLFLQSLPNTG